MSRFEGATRGGKPAGYPFGVTPDEMSRPHPLAPEADKRLASECFTREPHVALKFFARGLNGGGVDNRSAARSETPFDFPSVFTSTTVCLADLPRSALALLELKLKKTIREGLPPTMPKSRNGCFVPKYRP